MQEWTLLDQITQEYLDLLGANLLGVYAHGSMAFGCFRWETSDMDFLVVVHHQPSLEEKIAMIQVLVNRSRQAPPKGFEMSVVLAADCLHVRHPVPFSLHFSTTHLSRARQDLSAYCQGMHGCDPDLAAHFTVTRAVGRAVWGPPVQKVFGPVPREAYRDSILADVAQAEADVAENPVYVILNLCRVLAFLREEKVLSKQQGGQWGLDHLPETFLPVIRAALESYTLSRPYVLPVADGRAFARWILREIHPR